MAVETIDQVIEQLGAVVDDSRAAGSRLGFFAALYRRVTVQVKAGIDSGRFEDGPLTEWFDVVFSGRYLAALERWRTGENPGESWAIAFRTAERWRPLALQHLLLGMNAHINVDLGIAAARTCPGDALPQIKRDFDEINVLLAELVDDVQARIGTVSPWLGLLDRVGGRSDEALVNFSMRKARDAAWDLAERLAPLGRSEQAPVIERRDRAMAGLARIIRTPGIVGTLATVAVRLRETSDVRRVIDALS